MRTLTALMRRNIRLFFKDRGMFFTALVTPLILLGLYAAFLANVYRDSFAAILAPFGLQTTDQLLDGLIGGQLCSSLLAVCCVTVAFCSNLLMVQDKVTGVRNDLMISPVRIPVLSLSYYLATLISTLLICLVALGACLIYQAFAGWYLSATDLLWILLDVVLLVLFGTALSSLIHHFLSSQGQISAVSTIISAGYGFLCGAYMPISSFGAGLQKVLSFLPGTYGTVLLRQHTLRGVLQQMQQDGLSEQAISGLEAGLDCKISFFDHAVSSGTMYLILVGSTAVLIAAYILVCRAQARKAL